MVCDALDYIKLLHRPIAGRPAHTEPGSYTVDSDPSALQRLLPCLS